MVLEQAIIRSQQESMASEQARQHRKQFILSRQAALASSQSCRIDDPDSLSGYVSKDKESSSAATNPENQAEVLGVRSTPAPYELLPTLSDVTEELVTTPTTLGSFHRPKDPDVVRAYRLVLTRESLNDQCLHADV